MKKCLFWVRVTKPGNKLFTFWVRFLTRKKMIDKEKLKVRLDKFNKDNNTEYSFVYTYDKYIEYSNILEVLCETKPDDDPEFHILVDLTCIYEREG